VAVADEHEREVALISSGKAKVPSRNKAWSRDDCERLKALVSSGVSPLRASLALKRSVAVTKNKARELGVPFRSENEMKKERRQILEMN
jgi:hypothetical protein